MTTFKVETFDYQNLDFKNNINVCLEKLPEILRNEINTNLLAYSNLSWNIQYFPKAWAGSNRIGASALYLPVEQLIECGILINTLNNQLDITNPKKEQLKFAPFEVLAQLRMASNVLRFKFDQQSRLDKSAIKEAILLLEETLLREKLIFLHDTFQSTVVSLKKNLIDCGIDCYSEDLEALTKTMDENGICILLTANASLNFTKSAHVLAHSIQEDVITASKLNSLLKAKNKNPRDYFEDESRRQTIQRQAAQLSILAKRFADPFYENPSRRTISEDIRWVIRTSAATIASIFAIVALVSFFLMPPLAPVFLLISAVGYLVIVDDIVEIVREFWHGRSPTKAQVWGYAISVPLVALYLIGANIVSILTHLAASINFFNKPVLQILPILAKVSTVLNRQVPYFSGLSNLNEIILNAPITQALAGTGLILNLLRQTTYKLVQAATSIDNQPNEIAETIVATNVNGISFFKDYSEAKARTASQTKIELDIDTASNYEVRAKQIITDWGNISNEEAKCEFIEKHNTEINKLITLNTETAKPKNKKIADICKNIATKLIPLQHYKGSPAMDKYNKQNKT